MQPEPGQEDSLEILADPQLVAFDQDSSAVGFSAEARVTSPDGLFIFRLTVEAPGAQEVDAQDSIRRMLAEVRVAFLLVLSAPRPPMSVQPDLPPLDPADPGDIRFTTAVSIASGVDNQTRRCAELVLRVTRLVSVIDPCLNPGEKHSFPYSHARIRVHNGGVGRLDAVGDGNDEATPGHFTKWLNGHGMDVRCRNARTCYTIYGF